MTLKPFKPRTAQLHTQWKKIDFYVIKSNENLLESVECQKDFSEGIWSSRLRQLHTPTASVLKGKTPLTHVLDMTLNHRMVRLQ